MRVFAETYDRDSCFVSPVLKLEALAHALPDGPRPFRASRSTLYGPLPSPPRETPVSNPYSYELFHPINSAYN